MRDVVECAGRAGSAVYLVILREQQFRPGMNRLARLIPVISCLFSLFFSNPTKFRPRQQATYDRPQDLLPADAHSIAKPSESAASDTTASSTPRTINISQRSFRTGNLQKNTKLSTNSPYYTNKRTNRIQLVACLFHFFKDGEYSTVNQAIGREFAK